MKIGIIGAGLGGLATGVLLSKKGHSVEIFEKEPILGGRALTLNGSDLTLDEYQRILHRFDMWIPFSEPDVEKIFEKKLLHGYYLDLGFHLLGFISKNPILKILSGCNEKITFSSSRFKGIHPGKGATNGLPSYLDTPDKIRSSYYLLRFLLSRRAIQKKLLDTPLSETIQKYYKGKVGKSLGYGAMLVTTVNDLNKISSRETLEVLGRWTPGKGKAGYPAGGLISLSETLAKTIYRHKGKISLEEKVEEIIIENSLAKGLIIDNQRRDFDLIVSNIPIQGLFDIASEKEFPSDYVKTVKNLEGTGSVCAYYAFDKVNPSLIGRSYGFVEKDLNVEGGRAAGIIDFQITNPEIGVSPDNQHVVQAYIICSPDEARIKKKVELLREVLDKKMELLIPNYRENLLFALYPTTWHLDGVAKTIGNEKPDSVTPVKNLYIVGDCVKSVGIGMNCAVDSAIKLSMKLPFSK